MDENIYFQECNQCGKQFRVRYTLTGIEYIGDTCKCEADFSPVDGLSWTQWFEEQENYNCQ